jgi:hypothetical protein
MMDTEKFYIYRETKANNQINNKLTVQNNTIFETIVYEDPSRTVSQVKNSVGEVVHPTGSESYTGTEGHPLLTHGSAASSTKRCVSNNSKTVSGSS